MMITAMKDYGRFRLSMYCKTEAIRNYVMEVAKRVSANIPAESCGVPSVLTKS